MNLLYIDDNKALLDIWSKSLSKCFTVYSFYNPLEAIEWFSVKFKIVDLVITDYKMPNINGGDLLEKLNVIKKVPSILLTGYSNLDLWEKNISDVKPWSAMITKPVDKEYVLKNIRRIMLNKDVCARR